MTKARRPRLAMVREILGAWAKLEAAHPKLAGVLHEALAHHSACELLEDTKSSRTREFGKLRLVYRAVQRLMREEGFEEEAPVFDLMESAEKDGRDLPIKIANSYNFEKGQPTYFGRSQLRRRYYEAKAEYEKNPEFRAWCDKDVPRAKRLKILKRPTN